MAKRIPLTRGQFAIVDDHNYEWLMQWKWQARWNPGTQSFYAVRSVVVKNHHTSIQMHRLIMKTPNTMYCDHANHDTLCNLEKNLRNVTPSQNSMNRSIPSNNTTGMKNISLWMDGYYHVEVGKGNTRPYRKRFKTIEEAVLARDEALEKYHGEFANK